MSESEVRSPRVRRGATLVSGSLESSVTVGEVLVVVGGCVINAALATVFSFVVFMNSMNVAGCGPDRQCDLGLAQATIYMTPIAGVIAILVTVVLGLVLAIRGLSPWIAVTVGTALTVLGFVLAVTLNNTALQSTTGVAG